MRFWRFAILLTALAAADEAQADSLTLQGTGLVRGMVVGLDNGKLLMTTTHGDHAYPLAGVEGLHLDANPAFNDAEAAVLRHQFEKASRLYADAIRNTNSKPMKLLIDVRAIDADQKARKFLDAVVHWLRVVADSPTEYVLSLRPTELPEPTSTYLIDAAKLLETKLGDDAYTDERSQKSLKLLLLDIYNLQKDPRAISVAKELGATVDPALLAATLPVDVDDVAAVREVRAALQAKQYDHVVKTVDIALPGARGEVAVCLVMAKAVALEDQKNLAEAADAYLRVALIDAHCPEAAGALLSAVRIKKQLHEADEARTLITEIKEKYPGSAAAEAATKELP